jgi:hypothetical protein
MARLLFRMTCIVLPALLAKRIYRESLLCVVMLAAIFLTRLDYVRFCGTLTTTHRCFLVTLWTGRSDIRFDVIIRKTVPEASITFTLHPRFIPSIRLYMRSLLHHRLIKRCGFRVGAAGGPIPAL